MKKSQIVFLFLMSLIALNVMSMDTLRLLNGKQYLGEIKNISDCTIEFEIEKSIYDIPASDIFSLSFSDVNNPLFTDYSEHLGLNDNCLKGQMDAENYHGKGGMHFALGVLFGPFAVIGAALANPSPSNGNKTALFSQNKDLFNDASYLSCYKRKAKGKNVGNAALGWGAWVIFLILL